MIPKEFLCIDHQVLAETAPRGSLKHQIDKVRRQGCDCNIEMIGLWYDLCGFVYDLEVLD